MKRLLVANWKMNPDPPREARTLIAATRMVARSLRRTDIVLCPPAVFANLVTPARRLALGAQDISTELRGAPARPNGRSGGYTGSISAPMMKYSGATYTIIGHSERRMTGETDEIINKKIKIALGQNLRVILCVGELARDPRGEYLKHLRDQLEKAVHGLPKHAAQGLIIAYEPIWAITATAGQVGGGTDRADTPADFLEQAIFIRKVLSHWCGRTAALELPILYGGSVNPKNAASFITDGSANGLLVGHESLRVDHWREIMRLVDRC